MSYHSISCVHTSQREKPCLYLMSTPPTPPALQIAGPQRLRWQPQIPPTRGPLSQTAPTEIYKASQPSGGTSLKTQPSQTTPNPPPATSPQVATMVAPTPSLRNTTKPPTCNVAVVPSLKSHHPKSTKPSTCGCVCGTFSQTTPP